MEEALLPLPQLSDTGNNHYYYSESICIMPCGYRDRGSCGSTDKPGKSEQTSLRM